MKVSCEMELVFEDEATASNIARSIRLDNEGYVRSEVRGNVLWLFAESDSINTLRNTVDDLLACVSVAQKSIEGAD
jgi:hypothetical protein